MSFVPNSGNASIDPRKLNYRLVANPGKARFFARFGFDPRRPLELDVALRQRPVLHPFQSVLHSVHGTVRRPVLDVDARPA